MFSSHRHLSFSALLVALTFVDGNALADEPAAEKPKRDPAEQIMLILDGNFRLTAAEDWERKEPATNIVEHEFEIPAAEGDERPGRLTVMSAGGTIQDNLDRWYGQFKQPDGGSTREKAGEPEELEAAGQKIIWVELSGTYLDKPPRAPKGVERENYLMLAAIVQSEDHGNCYVKLYGPAQTIGDNKEAFREMIEALAAAQD